MKRMASTMAVILAGLLLLFALSAKARGHDSRIAYDTASQTLNTNSPEIVMARAKNEATYRFSAAIQTEPGEGCESDTTVDFVRSYVNTEGLSGSLRSRVTIRKDGATVSSTAEIPASTFRVKAKTAISYHVEYALGGQCKARPTYKVFPLLERVGR